MPRNRPAPTLSGLGLVVSLLMPADAVLARGVSSWELVTQPNFFDFADGSVLEVTRSSLSNDGRVAVFSSFATNLVDRSPIQSDDWHTFVRDRDADHTDYVSVGAPGTGGHLSGDGRFVTFQSNQQLVPGMTVVANQYPYLLDRTTGELTFIGIFAEGASGPLDLSGAFVQAISDDGRFTLLASKHPHVPADDDGGLFDAYAFDRLTGAIELVSAGPSLPGSRDYAPVAITGDGATVAMYSFDFGSGDIQFELLDRTSGAVTFVAPPSGLVPLLSPSLSDDGRWFTYCAMAYDPKKDMLVDPVRCFLFDRQLGATHEINALVGAANESIGVGALSEDGRFVFVATGATTLPLRGSAPPRLDGTVQGYRWDRTTGLFELLTEIDGAPANGAAFPMAATPDGVTVLVSTQSTNLVPGDDNGISDLVITSRPLPPLGDLDGDGSVGAPDLAMLLGRWGEAGPIGDFDSDGAVGAADLGLLLGAWSTGR